MGYVTPLRKRVRTLIKRHTRELNNMLDEIAKNYPEHAHAGEFWQMWDAVRHDILKAEGDLQSASNRIQKGVD